MYGNSVYDTYSVVAELGAGGCGAVYKAWHKRLQKHIVLKELKDFSQRAMAECRNEIEALKNIRNVHIPQVYDFLIDGKSSYTVMEYIDGVSFDTVLSKGELFPVGKVVKWYYQLATVLVEIHRNDVCHRDIKPGNVMLTPHGDVCLIDFNSAFVCGNMTGVVNRSIGYASPEQIMFFQMCKDSHKNIVYNADNSSGNFEDVSQYNVYPRHWRERDIDWKLSDIYSLGATMYHIYTGKHPPPYGMQDKQSMENTRHVYKQDERFLCRELTKIIERSIHANPKKRYLSASSLKDELQSLLQRA